MSQIWSGKFSRGARRRGWVAMVAAVGAAFLVAVSLTGPAAAGSPHRPMLAAKRPPGTPGELIHVTAVPHSTDVWLYGESVYGPYFEARRHHGHWQNVKPPSFGGKYGQPKAIGSGSSGSVWLGGSFQQKHSIQNYPAIWRWTGKRFVRAKLPKLFAGDCSVTAISASSPSNVWAVGTIDPPANTSIVMLHFNGKKWSIVNYPEYNDLNPIAVSTSSPTNAWATDGTNLFHWNGKVWVTDGTAPAGVQLNGVATDSSKLAYAVGFNTTTGKPVIMRFNGTTWSNAPLAPSAKHEDELEEVTMHGRSVWALGSHGSHPVILHSNGGVWSIQQTLATTFRINGISAQSSSHAYAVGEYYSARAGGNYTYVEYYNGHSWKGALTKV